MDTGFHNEYFLENQCKNFYSVRGPLVFSFHVGIDVDRSNLSAQI